MTIIHGNVGSPLSRRGLVAMLMAMALTACDGQGANNEPGAAGGKGGANTGGSGKTGGAPGTGGAPEGGGSGGEGGGAGTGGTAGRGGAAGGEGGTCTVSHTRLMYTTPGCGASTPAPICALEYACAAFACSCTGTIELGCLGFARPFAYPIPIPPSGTWPSGSCDPNAESGMGTGGRGGGGAAASGGGSNGGAR